MIVHGVRQGSLEWERLRLGIPTASRFHHIYQPSRRKPSKQRDVYLLELVDEYANQKREDPFESKWTRRGQELEPLAKFAYTMETGSAIQNVGFVTRDDGLVGGSPDGLVSDDVVLEVKVPSPQVFASYKKADPKHWCQTQGLLYVCERKTAHLWAFSDTDESRLFPIPRDDEWLADFVPCLNSFLADLEEEKHRIRVAYGVAS